MFYKGLLFHVPFQHLRSEESRVIVSAGSSQLTLLCFQQLWSTSSLLKHQNIAGSSRFREQD